VLASMLVTRTRITTPPGMACGVGIVSSESGRPMLGRMKSRKMEMGDWEIVEDILEETKVEGFEKGK
jgi:hypothetical protein